MIVMLPAELGKISVEKTEMAPSTVPSIVQAALADDALRSKIKLRRNILIAFLLLGIALIL